MNLLMSASLRGNKMHLMLLKAILITLEMTNGSSDFNNKISIDFIANYFALRGSNILSLVLCTSANDKRKLLKILMENGSYVQYRTIENFKDIEYLSGHPKLGVLFDTSCELNQEICDGLNSISVLSHPRAYWIILGRPKCSINISEVQYNTDTIIVERKPDDEVEIYDVYKTGVADDAAIVQILLYNGSIRSLNVFIDFGSYFNIPKSSKRNFNGSSVRFDVTIKMNNRSTDIKKSLTDFNVITKYNQSPNHAYHFSLIMLLAEMFKFKIAIVAVKPISKIFNENGVGHADKILSHISSGEADIFGSGIHINTKRVQNFDVILQTYAYQSGFILLGRDESSEMQKMYLRPFNAELWRYTLLMWICITISVYIITEMEMKVLKQRHSLWDTAILAAMNVHAAFCQVGASLKPHSGAAGIAYLTFYICTLLTHQYYKSSIVSTLLVEKIVHMDLKQLADSSYECSAVNESFAMFLLLESLANEKLKYFASKKKSQRYVSDPEGIRLMTSTKFAYHNEYVRVYPLIEKSLTMDQICRLVHVDTTPIIELGLLAKKNSPLTETFKIGLMRLRQTGLMSKERSFWVKSRPKCESSSEPEPASLMQVKSIHIALIIVYCGSFAILAVEMWIQPKCIRTIDTSNGKNRLPFRN